MRRNPSPSMKCAGNRAPDKGIARAEARRAPRSMPQPLGVRPDNRRKLHDYVRIVGARLATTGALAFAMSPIVREGENGQALD